MTAIDVTTSIFYVDDDVDDLEFFQQAVDEIGESAALFNLPDEMIRTLHHPPPRPSIIFLDLNMPFKSGFDVINELKQSDAFKDLPIVIYSTASDEKMVDRCRKLGASLYIVKPTSIAALTDAIRHVLGIDWESFTPTQHTFRYRR